MIKFLLVKCKGMNLLRKADLLDELRAEIGVVSDKCQGDIEKLYRFVCQILFDKMNSYQYVAIYFAKTDHFRCHIKQGKSSLPLSIPFGEGLFSLAALHGDVIMERVGTTMQAVVPFYRGHHLVGELVVLSAADEGMDDEDLTLFCEIASLLERKVRESFPKSDV